MSDQLPGRLNVDTPASTRDALVERFARWLDAILTREEPPGGIDRAIMAAVSAAPIDPMDATDDDLESAGAADERTDAYALWSALTVLAHEVKLQGRAFKDLSVALDSQAARSADELRRSIRSASDSCSATSSDGARSRCSSRCWTCATGWGAGSRRRGWP